MNNSQTPTIGDLLDTDRAADIASENMRSLGGHCDIAVDSTGVGAGTLAKLIRAGRMARACRFRDGAKNPKMFVNRKAELFWEFREALRKGEVAKPDRAGGFAIAPLENEDYVFADLASVRYTTNTKDQILCEPKEKTRARLGRSPDSEAAVIALSIPAGIITTEQEPTVQDDEQMSELQQLGRLFVNWER